MGQDRKGKYSAVHYTRHNTWYRVNSMSYILHSTKYRVQRTEYATYNTLYTVHSKIQYTDYGTSQYSTLQ